MSHSRDCSPPDGRQPRQIAGAATFGHELCGTGEFLVSDFRGVRIRAPVEPLAFRPTSLFPESIPVLSDVNGSQAHNALRPLERPAHPGEFQSVVDEIPACALNDSAADGIAHGQTDLVPHVLAVPFEIPDDLVEVVPLGVRKLVLGQHLLESADDSACFPYKEHSQALGHEFPGLGGGGGLGPASS
jgi:hypothetical protein